MQTETLTQRIERMRRRLANGAVVPSEVEALLGEVQLALAQVHDPVTSALRALSYTERESVRAIIEALPEETGGLLVASQVADRNNLTRSVIVNALRKFESAGVMECRSLGMKGTHVKLLNGLTSPVLLERIAKFGRFAA